MTEATPTSPPSSLLAILPNGEAVRPERVLDVTIETAVLLYDCEIERFDVVVHLVDGTVRAVGKRLLRANAERLASDTAEAINTACRRFPR